MIAFLSLLGGICIGWLARAEVEKFDREEQMREEAWAVLDKHLARQMAERN